MMTLPSPTLGLAFSMGGNRRTLSTHDASTFVQVEPQDADQSATQRSNRGEWILHDPDHVLNDQERYEILEGAWRENPNGLLGPDDDASGTEPWPDEAFDPGHVVSWWLEWKEPIDD